MRKSLSSGDQGGGVCVVQSTLKTARFYTGPVDGTYGEETKAAVEAFQKDRNLVVSGEVNPQTWKHVSQTALIQGRSSSEAPQQALDPAVVKQAASDLNIDDAALKAFAEVESNGGGFLSDGRVKILFERHWMYRRLRDNISQELADNAKAASRDVVNTTPGGYIGGGAEWDRFDKAAPYDRDSAIESASYGRFQLMGFHWQSLGYSSAEAFLEEMESSEEAQLEGIKRFIAADPSLTQAIQNKDWATTAYIYNGPNYRQNRYDTKLARAYEKYKALG